MLSDSLFPLSARMVLPTGLQVDGLEAAEFLQSQMTLERRKKIESVLQQRNFYHTMVLENIYDRGNSSAVMRSAEALGFGQIHLIETQEKFKAANRVTQGADKWLSVEKWKTTSEGVTELKRRGFQICVTTLEDATAIGDVDFNRPSALVLGNEHAGASAEMHALADVRVKIPMSGFVQSFNISVAGALCLYHLFQTCEKLPVETWQLSERQKDILRAHYYYRSVDAAAEKLGYHFKRP